MNYAMLLMVLLLLFNTSFVGEGGKVRVGEALFFIRNLGDINYVIWELSKIVAPV
jgi:hypothetical protein